MRAVSALPSLILFARAPEPGRVKTRLEPLLGVAGAAALYRAFLQDAGRIYGRGADWAPVVAVEGDSDHPELRSLFPAPWRRVSQASGDLGEKLSAAFEEEFERGAPAAVAVGSDHPGLLRSDLNALFGILSSGMAALIPADDGGYCAVGLACLVDPRAIFSGIPWSSSSVLEETLERAADARISVGLLPPAYDVDRPEDLARLRADLSARDPASGDYPTATAALLAAMAGGAP